jgi:tetraacyldisaccharide 4'-kinase
MREPAFWWREAGLASGLLAPLAAVYGAIASARLAQRGAHVTVPVVCIGNPTVGGAGKTPLTLTLARLLQAAGDAPILLSRGYRGRLAGPLRVDAARHHAGDVGDEPLLLARVAPTFVARNRVVGARAAVAAGASVIVMDDGFQNPSLQKNFSVLVVDARRGIGNGRVVPAGPLRAPLAAQLVRADALVVVGASNDGVAAAARGRGDPQLPGPPSLHVGASADALRAGRSRGPDAGDDGKGYGSDARRCEARCARRPRPRAPGYAYAVESGRVPAPLAHKAGDVGWAKSPPDHEIR